MSGGVDSSVAAALLKRAGFDVVGIYMKMCDGKKESEKLARLVAKKIGIPFYVLNIEKEFKKKVVDYFLAEYKKGNTPNPCIVCNKEIKFGFLINKALSLGADFVATGHYARTSLGSEFSASVRAASAALTQFAVAGSLRETMPSHLARYAPNSLPRLFVGADKEKDQSYFLWQLSQEQLKHVMFPVGGYTKQEVRKLAKKFKLPTAETPESQEVCFIADATNNFLKKYLKTKPGKITNKTGKVLGKHNGLWFYTIGQRRGLEIPQGPYYVVDKDFKKNILIVSKNQKDLLKKELITGDVNWISGKEPKLPIRVKAKIRYRHNLASATISKIQNTIYKIRFSAPQRAVTPGQSVVFYKDSELMGGGIIK